uniref:Protein transport protein Sec24-like At3g07100 n=1 Tax=Anthurium amnicola TaxID=1678845 RepID=A0A1D1XLC4_9ARAE
MQSAGSDKQGPPNFGGRPVSPFAAAPPRTLSPFASSGPIVGQDMSNSPRTSLSYQSSMPVPGPGAVHPQQNSMGFAPAAVSGAAPPLQFTGPSSPPTPPSYTSKDTIQYTRFPTPQFPPPTVQSLQSATFAGAQAPPPIGPRPPSVPMGPPVQNVSPMQLRASIPPPPLQSSLPSSGPSPQSHLPPYSNMPPRGNVPLQHMDSPFPAPVPLQQPHLQANLAPHFPTPTMRAPFQAHQGGFTSPPPVAAPLGFGSREQMQQPGMAPPVGGVLQNLVEDFQSLSIGSTPGSIEMGIDLKSLPRPSDTEIDPIPIADTYPLNCHSRYLRLTTHAIPSSQSLQARWHLPLGAVVHPLAESPDGEEVPIVNFGPAGVVRCRRCRTYINPYVTFTDVGRKWRCNLCSMFNDVSGEYFCTLDARGMRCDLDQRPELTKGSVEIVAPTEYMVRPPMPPLYFFLIDVSASAIRSGMLEIVANTIKSCLDDLPGSPRTQIGFLTFDSTLHFYNLKSSLTQPQMMVVADLDDIFVPLPDDLLVNLSDSRNVVDAFLDSLPTMFQENISVESALGPALRATFMVMSQLGGKLLVFQSTLPSLGVGRLKLRGDDLRIYGTDKEHTLRIPEDPFYKQMAAEFTKCQIGVDVYAFSDKYNDIASLGTLSKYTGGQVYYYPAFRADIHQEKLRFDLSRDLTRETAWEAVMRIRCGKGVRFTTYHGNFMLRSTDLLALPVVDCDKAFAMQLSLEETLMTTQTVYFQVALLYTSSSGERRIRVHTAAAPVVTELGDMYRYADVGATISLMSRLAIEKTFSQKLEDARQSILLRITKSLKEYRNLHAVQHRLGGRLIYPESLKFLPLYGLALCKSLALRGGYADVLLDERCAAGYSMMILPVRRMLKLLYPSLIKVDEILIKASQVSDNSQDLLEHLPLTKESLDPKGLYVYDDGFRFIIWFGRMLSADIATSILGVDSSGFPELSRVNLCEQGNVISKKLMGMLRSLRRKDPSCHQLCFVVRQGEQPREGSLFQSNLIEDQNAGIGGYGDWILQIYRQTQQSP